MPRAFGYASTAPQNEYFNSVEVQAQHIEEFYHETLEAKGLTWGGVTTDGGAGLDNTAQTPFLHRPGALNLHVSIQPRDHIILDRLAQISPKNFDAVGRLLENWRNRVVFAHLLREEIHTDTPEGSGALRGIQAAINAPRKYTAVQQYIRHHLGKDMKKKRLGSTHHGKGVVLPNAEERAIMGALVHLRDDCDWTWPAISEHIEGVMAAYVCRFPYSLARRRFGLRWCRRAYKREKELRAARK